MATRSEQLEELRPWIALMAQADAAEAQGDAAVALALMTSRPLGPDGKPFWRPWRLRALEQLVSLDPALPRWVCSRWIQAQALQQMSDAARSRTRKALELAARARDRRDEPTGVSRADVQAKVMDRDWVFRQAYLYELGGLTHFLRGADRALVQRADSIHDWVGAPMGGYRLLGSDPAVVVWRDLATGERVRVANHGCASLVVPGEHAIGRLVPIQGGRMFETAPLFVPHAVARRVADDPAGWVEAVAEGHEREAPIRTGGHCFDLVTDVPPTVWRYAVLGEDAALPDPEAADPRRVARAVLSCARGVLAAPTADLDLDTLGPDALDLWPCLAAALLEPGVTRLLPEELGPGDATVLEALGEQLPDPAAAVCRALARHSRDAA